MGENLESIMEKWFAEKAARISEIRVKYEMKIKDLEQSKAYTEILDLKNLMEEEISKIGEILDNKRRAEINRLRINL
jgi:hypothetical protein